MSQLRNLFLNHVAQTSPLSLSLEVDRAERMYIWDVSGKKYMDLNSGISVSSLGHRHPAVLEGIEAQLGKYMHTMVYGEHIQSPQVVYASVLAQHLDNQLHSVYFLNSGSEAVEVALKLARRYSHRYEIVSCAGAYHGSTLFAESLRSDIKFTRSFMPGVPGVKHIAFNKVDDLEKINEHTACVILEPVQAESGVVLPEAKYLQAVRKRCDEVGCLMILDEIQTGNGRTGYFMAHQKYEVVPDILLLGKAMGGGMPVSAVVSSKEILSAFTEQPALGHITTFGGHPVTVAAAVATLNVLTSTDIIEEVAHKEQLFHKYLQHPIIQEVRSSGLMMAVELTKRKYLKHVVAEAINRGVLIDYFLFNNKSFRLAPPLIISDKEIRHASDILLAAMDYAQAQYRL